MPSMLAHAIASQAARGSEESNSDSDIDMIDNHASQSDQDDQENQSHQEDEDGQPSEDDEGNTTEGVLFPPTPTNTNLLLLMQNDFNETGFVHPDFLPPGFAPGLAFPDDDDLVETDSLTGDDSDEDDGNDEFNGDKVPPIAHFRLNLTALSQRYNMYVAAYRNTIHVSRVRSCVDNALPARPDLMFRPPMSQEAGKVGGYIDHNMPHQMNHLIIGDLGNEEILLLACDDGDKLRQGPLIDVSEVFGDKIDHDFFHHREYGYRFVLETGELGSNIPNVAFTNNADGDAIGILAVDISGKLWVLDIWSYDYPPHRFPRGWGVLVLPASSFLPTNTFQDSLGLSPAEAVYVRGKGCGYYIGTGKSVKHIKDNSVLHPWVRENRTHRFRLAPHWHGIEASVRWYNEKSDCCKEWTADQDEAADNPSEQVTLGVPINNSVNNTVILPDGSSVMRTYEKDIELVGGDQNIGIMFDNAIHQQIPPQTLLPFVQFSPERLSNLLHVPELCLVVAASLCGRVALITLTRPSNPHYSFKRGFRVEAILPKRTEEDHRIRPICLLLGVAIGPIPSVGGGNNRLLGDRRYRIMLHYYDHRILSYEVHRNSITGELSVT
ncbi:hypothetical protein E0Z10_g2129 [Xylaria hypoxylon]|uniref:Uncharacterized protein n=1 Tax=Xylaria hypoxylon TaxID=37992 RepID=A0A4Z0ZD55_9PEZI|nr:hypothetical protein E0Z10_g2129 [Xylaria hypoxylon]